MYSIDIVPVVALGVGLIIAMTRILSKSIIAYKLKVEQIRADAQVRAEEVRSRNQLELEKLIQKDQNAAGNEENKAGQFETSGDNRQVREKINF